MLQCCSVGKYTKSFFGVISVAVCDRYIFSSRIIYKLTSCIFDEAHMSPSYTSNHSSLHVRAGLHDQNVAGLPLRR